MVTSESRDIRQEFISKGSRASVPSKDLKVVVFRWVCRGIRWQERVERAMRHQGTAVSKTSRGRQRTGSAQVSPFSEMQQGNGRQLGGVFWVGHGQEAADEGFVDEVWEQRKNGAEILLQVDATVVDEIWILMVCSELPIPRWQFRDLFRWCIGMRNTPIS